MEVIWKPVIGYEGVYEVSNYGNVRRVNQWDGHGGFKKNLRTVKPTLKDNGYLYVSLSKGHVRHNYFVHRLVAQAFIDNPNNYPCVNHLDYNRANNVSTNLEWCTHHQNTLYSAPNMHHARPYIKTNTGERYITYRASKGVYRVIIKEKEYGSYRSIEKAITKRDEILRETGYGKGIIN